MWCKEIVRKRENEVGKHKGTTAGNEEETRERKREK